MATAECVARTGQKGFPKNATVSDRKQLLQYESWIKIIFFINLTCHRAAVPRCAFSIYRSVGI